MRQLAWNQGSDVIECINFSTIANVYTVELIEVYWVCRKFKDELAGNLPILYSECFHECKIKGFSDPTEDIALLNYLYNERFN